MKHRWHMYLVTLVIPITIFTLSISINLIFGSGFNWLLFNLESETKIYNSFGSTIEIFKDFEIILFGILNAIAIILSASSIGVSILFWFETLKLHHRFKVKSAPWHQVNKDALNYPLRLMWICVYMTIGAAMATTMISIMTLLMFNKLGAHHVNLLVIFLSLCAGMLAMRYYLKMRYFWIHFGADLNAPLNLMGMIINYHDAPKIWSQVNSICENLNVPSPSHIVFSLQEDIRVIHQTIHLKEDVPYHNLFLNNAHPLTHGINKGHTELTDGVLVINPAKFSLLKEDEAQAAIAAAIYRDNPFLQSDAYETAHQGLTSLNHCLQRISSYTPQDIWSSWGRTSTLGIIQFWQHMFLIQQHDWHSDVEKSVNKALLNLLGLLPNISYQIKSLLLNKIVLQQVEDIKNLHLAIDFDHMYEDIRHRWLEISWQVLEHPEDYIHTDQRRLALQAKALKDIAQEAYPTVLHLSREFPNVTAQQWLKVWVPDFVNKYNALAQETYWHEQSTSVTLSKSSFETVAMKDGRVIENKRPYKALKWLSFASIAAIVTIAIYIIETDQFELIASTSITNALVFFGAVLSIIGIWSISVAALHWFRFRHSIFSVDGQGIRAGGLATVVNWCDIESYSIKNNQASNSCMLEIELKADINHQLTQDNVKNENINYHAQKNTLEVSLSQIKGRRLSRLKIAMAKHFKQRWHHS